MSTLSLPIRDEDDGEDEEENPSNDSKPSFAPNRLTCVANSPSPPSISTRLTTTPSCWSVMSSLCTDITSNSSDAEFTATARLFPERMRLCESLGKLRAALATDFAA